MRRRVGFTLVEMVVVLLVLGILSVGSVQFISRAAEGYASGGRRAELTSSGRSAMMRLSAELSNALTRSVRVDGSCIEFVPIWAATQYRTLPRVTPANSLELAILDADAVVSSARIAVSPNDESRIYGLTAISPLANLSAPDGDNLVTATLSAPHQFPQGSAQSRAYLVGDPVSFCLEGTSLLRLSGYGFSANQGQVVNLRAAGATETIVGDQLDSGASNFFVTTLARDRSASVDVRLVFTAEGESLPLQSTVQVRNAP